LRAFDDLLGNDHSVNLHGVEAVESEHILSDGINMHYGAFEDLLFEDSFDIACMIELIEHLFEPEVVLNKLFETLKPGGIAYLSTPNWYGADFQFIGDAYRNLRAPTHIQFFNPQSLTRLMERCGFVNVVIDTPGILDVSLILKHAPTLINQIDSTDESGSMRCIAVRP
tara:strand:- start:5406 stop:5912 length:507 start_codon:yes stop_codon:yes gene_type:complete